MRGSDLRRAFLGFFEDREHQVVRSSSLVPDDDPTLLFVNAGMVQFKDMFLGQRKVPYSRAVTAQRCLRVGGKHNDLEHVGKTRRHNTFFEMLGNFSFGDYFKREAIGYAWEFLVGELRLDPDSLWATVHHEDSEARDLWPEITGISPDRVVGLGDADNFWSMGETGPCGPCSEIIIDRGEHLACGDDCALGVCDCDRWLELWNLVFMQYDRDADGKMTPLPAPSIDTGISLERLASVLQGVDSNFETDLFWPLISQLQEWTEREYEDGPGGLSFRVVADHIRAGTFLVADGVLPRNEGRGYVLRRILRRAVRMGRSLGFSRPFLHRLVPVALDILREAYPEALERQELICGVIRAEEERFLEVLESGLGQLESIIQKAGQEGRRHLTGAEAFLLYDTYGFPVDLTEDVAEERGLELDREEFEQIMLEQRERARRAGLGQEVPEFHLPEVDQQFVGYGELEGRARVLAVSPHPEGSRVVLDRTPLYGEAGGQVGDTGWLETGGESFRVVDSRWAGDVIYHVLKGESAPEEGLEVRVRVDRHRREAVARSHTATHVLHGVLREVLGDHVTQAGSLVAPDRLRFDFTHFQALDDGEIQEIESRVNARILEGRAVAERRMSYDEARQEGAIALFGEKYEEDVRVVEIDRLSRELCGGTHVGTTGQIGLFALLSEASVGAGMRRIEALVGRAAQEEFTRLRGLADECSGLLRCDHDEIPSAIEQLLEERRRWRREAERFQQKTALERARSLVDQAHEVSGTRVVTAEVPEGGEQMKQMADSLRQELGSGAVVLGARQGGSVQLLVAATSDLVERGLHCGQVISRAAREVSGGGGGRPEFAQAGGKDPEGLEKALRVALEEVETHLEGER